MWRPYRDQTAHPASLARYNHPARTKTVTLARSALYIDPQYNILQLRSMPALIAAVVVVTMKDADMCNWRAEASHLVVLSARRYIYIYISTVLIYRNDFNLTLSDCDFLIDVVKTDQRRRKPTSTGHTGYHSLHFHRRKPCYRR